METKDYIELLTQAPLAVILIVYLYKSDKRYTEFVKDIMKLLKKE